MIDIFNQYSLPVDAVLGATEGKLFYGDKNPTTDDLSAVPIGSYYLRDFESMLHHKYGPNQGDWTVINAGSATRSLGAILRVRNTVNRALNPSESIPLTFGTFDISTAPDVVRSPNEHSVSFLESGNFVFQYWFSVIGNPADLEIELSVNGVVVPNDQGIVSGITMLTGIVPTDAVTVRAINKNTSAMTIQEFHAIAIKIDVPTLLDESTIDGGAPPVSIGDGVTDNTILSEMTIGEGLVLVVDEQGAASLTFDASVLPTPTDHITIDAGPGILKSNTLTGVSLAFDASVLPDPQIIPDPITIDAGTGIIAGVTPTGYSIAFDNSVLPDPQVIPDPITVAGGVGITVNSTLTGYTVSFDNSVIPDPVTVEGGVGITATATPTGYSLAFDDSVLPDPVTVVGGTGITVNSTLTGYSLSFDDSVLPDPPVIPDPVTVEGGVGITATPTPTGYSLTFDDSVLPDPQVIPDPVTVVGGTGITVNSTLTGYSLSFDDSVLPDPQVIPDPVTVEGGVGITATATPTGYSLSFDDSVLPNETALNVTNGTIDDTNVSKLTIGDGLTLTQQQSGDVTLAAATQSSGSGHHVFSAYCTYNSSVYWAARRINWDMEMRKDTTHYEHNIGSNEVKILKAGWYKIGYDVSLSSSSSNRTSSRSYVVIDGDEFDGSESFGYHRTSSQSQDTSSATVVAYLYVGTKVGVESIRKSGSATLYTIPYASRINIAYLGE